MKFAGICFTKAGMELARRIRQTLEQRESVSEQNNPVMEENHQTQAQSNSMEEENHREQAQSNSMEEENHREQAQSNPMEEENDRALVQNNRVSVQSESMHETEIIWYAKGKAVEVLADSDFQYVTESLQEWTGKRFADSQGILFVGAAGIAVRAIASFVRDKRHDPAILVMDEKGTFCIPLLSGHIGGANEWACRMAEKTGAVPVITTATDVNGRFAVDVFASKNNMVISDMSYAKEISAALLSGESVGFHSDLPVVGGLPEGLVRQERGRLGITISPFFGTDRFDHTLRLIPKCLTLGIGCRRGTGVDKIAKLADEVLIRHRLDRNAISQVATIDLKKDEAGLLEFCRMQQLPLLTYSAEELKSVSGDFSGSGFVAEITGVDNVCERSAVLAGGELIIKKVSGDGVTCAVALQKRRVEF